ncbi:Formamidopyrimidine-DNA glycosylase N-terminal domain-containing protein [Dipodascopsis uninucleata]
MPELGEVAHAAKLLTTHLKGRTIRKFLSDSKDAIVFPSLSATDHLKLQSDITNKFVNGIGRHGKYFWIVLQDEEQFKPKKSRQDTGRFNVLLMHFGMTGWIKIKDIKTHFVRMEESKNGKIPEKTRDTEWPPKYDKFLMELDDGGQIAFIDPRRLGRIRLIPIDYTGAMPVEKTEDYVYSELMKVEPLCRQGPDFSKPDRWEADRFEEQISRRKVPVKSFFLDQAFCAGVGNWMADEILFQSRVHPEQYTNTLNKQQITKLYNNLCQICEIAVETEANPKKFPSHWLMIHRWSKRLKANERNLTSEGYKVDFITVGGRTSCFVPELQKKIKEIKQDSEKPKQPLPTTKEREIKDEGVKSKGKKRKARE